MKYCEEKNSESDTVTGFKLGIVRLGRAAGKVKYALLDESDIDLVQKYAFEAKLHVDPNGNGAAVFAWTYDMIKGPGSGQYLQDLLWEMHRGGIPTGWRVVHKNKVTVDNRLDNLALSQITNKPSYYPCLTQRHEQSLYWVAMEQIPTESMEQYYADFLHSYYQVDDYTNWLVERHSYYECRHIPCTNIEQQPRQFSICSRCREARYCGIRCQQNDWSRHERICRETKLPTNIHDRLPER